LPRRVKWKVPLLEDRGGAQVAAEQIRATMWGYAGIDRRADGLRRAIEELEELLVRLPAGATEEANMAQTGHLIASAALMRKESRGGHYRRDFPRPKNKWRGRHIEF
jgi:L-aspartate oxidase